MSLWFTQHFMVTSCKKHRSHSGCLSNLWFQSLRPKFNQNVLLSVTLSSHPIAQKATWPTVLTAWNNKHVTEETDGALFPQQRELGFTSAVRKQEAKISFDTSSFVYGALVLLSGRLLSLLLCFLEYLEWVLHEKAYLKRTWGTLGSPQQLPSCAPPSQPLNHSPKPRHHSRNAYNSASSYCTAVMKGVFFWVLRVMPGSVFNLWEVTGS